MCNGGIKRFIEPRPNKGIASVPCSELLVILWRPFDGTINKFNLVLGFKSKTHLLVPSVNFWE
ncbi:hypothetical protein Fmac_016627 [Flemingia macrophylla]|uniref:Uncharacterized protein n=1 Tax=Flemingia macrophylla TaxID=520843 RepID=A0ABD1MHZ3_9FABA